jgi:hypothetical protein
VTHCFDFHQLRKSAQKLCLLLDGRQKKIRSTQFKAVLAVNRELIQLYWDIIGREIVERQEKDGLAMLY